MSSSSKLKSRNGGKGQHAAEKLSKKLNTLLEINESKNETVVKEFPVYLSKTLMNQLCLLQYPQRAANVPSKNMRIVQSKIKPKQNKIQLGIEIEKDSELFDAESSELLAEAAEGLGLDEDQYMPDHRLKIDKTTMESTTVPKLTEMTRYAVGVVRQGQVTLTPLNSIVQMKTVFPYLNKAEKARTAFQKQLAQSQTGAETEDEEEEATKVTVKFSRNTASQGEKANSKTSSYSARKTEEEEAWVDFEYEYNDNKEFDKLYTTKTDVPFYVVPKKEYLGLIFPKHVETIIDGAGKSKNHNPRISIQEMKLMAVPEQLQVLLSNGKVMRYQQIVDFLKIKLKSEFDETTLVRSVQTVGILVQGCWVVKSDVIYPEDFKSGLNAISGLVMQRGRDAILGQFTENRCVERRKMMSLTKLPPEEVTEILSQVSVMISKKGWEFLLPFDSEFVSKFPEVVERQSMIWQMKKQQRIRHSSSSGSMDTSPPRRRSRNKSISSEDEAESDGHGSRRRRQSDTGGSGARRQRRSSTRSDIGIPSRIET